MRKSNRKLHMKMHPIRRISKNKNSRFKFIKDYFLSNIREYAIVGIMLLIGIFIGVMFINNCKENSKIQIENYINEYIQNLKNEDNIDYLSLTKVAIKKNIVLSVLLWFAGTTIIGIPIVFGIILFRGGCLGFSITACINTLGLGKGLSFILIAIFLQNIIFIPAIITSGVSSFNLYNAIAQKRKIKPEIIKHTLLSLMMMGILVISAIVEINVSCKILEKFIKYF